MAGIASSCRLNAEFGVSKKKLEDADATFQNRLEDVDDKLHEFNVSKNKLEHADATFQNRLVDVDDKLHEFNVSKEKLEHADATLQNMLEDVDHKLDGKLEAQPHDVAIATSWTLV